jgi:hypothetical protein
VSGSEAGADQADPVPPTDEAEDGRKPRGAVPAAADQPKDANAMTGGMSIGVDLTNTKAEVARLARELAEITRERDLARRTIEAWHTWGDTEPQAGRLRAEIERDEIKAERDRFAYENERLFAALESSGPLDQLLLDPAYRAEYDKARAATDGDEDARA